MEELQQLAAQYRSYFREDAFGRLSSGMGTKWNYFSKEKKRAIRFLALEQDFDVLNFFDLRYDTINRLVNTPHYEIVQIPKKRGGFRTIYMPEALLGRVQRKVNTHLQAVYGFLHPPVVHGFVRKQGREQAYSIVSNATAHVNKPFILQVDIKDFFNVISARKIRDLFQSEIFQFNTQLATILTLLVTHDGKLPQGAASSPILSNLYCLNLDNALIQLSEKAGITYTRYADDLTFSSETPFADRWLQQVEQCLEQHGFSCNKKKTRFTSRNRKQCVTGIIVNKHLNVDQTFYKSVRAMLHDLHTNGLEAATRKHYNLTQAPDQMQRAQFVAKLAGLLSFIKQVIGTENERYLRLDRTFKALTGIET